MPAMIWHHDPPIGQLSRILILWVTTSSLRTNVSSDPGGTARRLSLAVTFWVEDETIPSKLGNRSGIIALL